MNIAILSICQINISYQNIIIKLLQLKANFYSFAFIPHINDAKDRITLSHLSMYKHWKMILSLSLRCISVKIVPWASSDDVISGKALVISPTVTWCHRDRQRQTHHVRQLQSPATDWVSPMAISVAIAWFKSSTLHILYSNTSARFLCRYSLHANNPLRQNWILYLVAQGIF